MVVIAVFIAFVIVGDVLAYFIAVAIEQYSETASLLAFLGMFVLVFMISWVLAVRTTERYLVRQN